MRTTKYSLERLSVMIVAFHFIVSLVHGAAHTNLHIDMNPWQTVYILLVITALPLVSGYLLWRRKRGGFLLLLGSMSGALVFGGYYHFIAPGADNVGSLGSHSWALWFQLTAVLLALTETGGVLIGFLGAVRKQ